MSNMEYIFNTYTDELNKLAEIHAKLLIKLKKIIKTLRENEQDNKDLIQIMRKLRLLRSRVSQIFDHVNRGFEQKNNVSEETLERLSLLIYYFEMSGLRDEERLLKIIIKKNVFYKEGLKKDLEEINMLRNIATNIIKRSL